jgi:TPR repeat protein
MKRILALLGISLVACVGVMFAFQDIIFRNSDTPLRLPFAVAMASLGSTEKQYDTGHLYENGAGLKTDLDKAVYWYTKAGEKGHKEAQFRLGRILTGEDPSFKNKSDTEAFKWLQKAAEQGHPLATDDMCRFYFLGKGVAQDYAKALEWCRKSAQATPDGQFRLASLYLLGKGVPQDIKEALRLMTEAKGRGSRFAADMIGKAVAGCRATTADRLTQEQMGYCYIASETGDAYAKSVVAWLVAAKRVAAPP